MDAATGGRYERTADRHAAVDDRPSIITSGMLVRRSAFADVPGFREDFFVDCVDSDFCLRVRRSGRRVVRDAALVLPHSIGSGATTGSARSTSGCCITRRGGTTGSRATGSC